MEREKVPMEQLIKLLEDLLSFDRPASDEKKVRNARDAMLDAGYPVGNDFRPRAAYSKFFRQSPKEPA